MITVEDIKAAIPHLTLSERAEIAKCLHGWQDDEWDDQIKHDHDTGKLDDLLNQVRNDIQQGRLEEGP